MFFFPYSTDAPIYHLPLATVGMIFANVGVFMAMVSGGIIEPDGWILTFGQGLHPNEWLTSMFSHGGLGHLAGNMLFLWVFGLITEGKLGALKFLACYLGIGVSQAGLEQLVMLGYSGDVPGSLGASSAIFGLMALAAVWAPMNEVTFFWTALFRAGTFDVSILMMAGFYTGMEILWVIIFGGDAGTSLLHLSGFVVGLPVGIILLKTGVVDCEGWDVFHVFRGDYGAFKQEPSAKEIIADGQKREQTRNEKLLTDAGQLFRQYLAQGNYDAAARLVEKMKSTGGGLALGRDELLAVIKGLHSAKKWSESAPYMAEFIAKFPQQADAMRIKLAQICVVELQRPAKALELLREIKATKLNEQTAALAKRVAAKARQMQLEGAVELDTEAW
jgi:membrane associated rhomboid family serine protease